MYSHQLTKLSGYELKIGIITILKVNNYGAELQAFALQHKLINLGFTTEIIDYLYYKNKDFLHTQRAKPFVKLSFSRKMKEWLNPLREKIKSIPYRHAKKNREKNFDTFHSNHTLLSAKTYKSIDDLYNTQFDYDIFMVGSDQVWNPHTNISLKPYFLTFVPENKRKVSYASSFGVSTIARGIHPIYKTCLNNLDKIAVREKQGVAIVAEITGRKAQHVVDPTFLLSKQEWQEIAISPKSNTPYLLLYALTDSSYITMLAKNIASDLDLKIIRLCKNAVKQDNDPTIENIIDAGPAEFVGLFLEASFVITNSFHGTTFAINFQKPFFTITPKNKANNSRQEGILDLLHLKKRLICEGASCPEPQNYPLDFTLPFKLLTTEKEQSIQYLLSCASGIEVHQ